jgi:hypothetical protein
MKRRELLKAGLAFGAAAVVPGCAFGANERVTLGIMGVNGRGRALAQGFASLPEAQIKYVCDVDSRVIPKTVELIASKQGKTPEAIGDFGLPVANGQKPTLRPSIPKRSLSGLSLVGRSAVARQAEGWSTGEAFHHRTSRALFSRFLSRKRIWAGRAGG